MKIRYVAISENWKECYQTKKDMLKDIKHWGDNEIHCYSTKGIDTNEYGWESELTSEEEIFVLKK